VHGLVASLGGGRALREVRLVVDDDARQRAGSRATIARSSRGQSVAALARVDEHERDVGRSTAAQVRSMPRRSTASPVSRKSRGVDHRQRDAADLDRTLDGVARRARDVGHDRDVVAGEPVHQARLADVRASDEHDAQARAEAARRSPRARAGARRRRARARACATRPTRARIRRPPRESRASPR
jgi:hypothetical protein